MTLGSSLAFLSVIGLVVGFVLSIISPAVGLSVGNLIVIISSALLIVSGIPMVLDRLNRIIELLKVDKPEIQNEVWPDGAVPKKIICGECGRSYLAYFINGELAEPVSKCPKCYTSADSHKIKFSE